jgi:hypothetical protein
MLGFAQFLLTREHRRRDENGTNELCFEAVENCSSNRKKKAPPPTCLLLLSDPWRAAAVAANMFPILFPIAPHFIPYPSP